MTIELSFVKKACLFGGLFFFSNLTLSAQDDLLAELEGEQETTEYAFATFKGTRVINLQSPEIPGKGVLQYMFLHRFGSFTDDFFYNFLGMDNAEVRLQIDYSFTDWLNVGFARSSTFPKSLDGFLKYRIARQKSGAENFPFTLMGYSNLNYQYEPWSDGLPHNESERFSYTNQLIIARKISPNFSLELVPTVVHFNIVDSANQSNDLFALGAGARYKLTPSLALSVEYIHQFNPYERLIEGTMQPYENILSVGVDIETGGHVFQLFFTNSRGVADPYLISRTPGSWLDGDIHFGFNISRVFTIVRPKELKGE